MLSKTAKKHQTLERKRECINACGCLSNTVETQNPTYDDKFI